MLDYLILKQLFELWHHQNMLVNHHGSFGSTLVEAAISLVET